MPNQLLRNMLAALLLITGVYSYAQEVNTGYFRESQLAAPRVADALRKYTDSVKRDFKRKNVAFPPKDIYLRAFKWQNELELWARSTEAGEYKLIKVFRVCAISGDLGPKRTQGDRQVPEGFYFIEEFNPHSDYHLSMKLSYPNYSDQVFVKGKSGGEIYIHGGCVTVGCLPMTDEGAKELYTICLSAKLNGQDNIPVHIFPTRLSKYGMSYLKSEFPKDLVKQQFWADLKIEYDYFEKYHRLLPVMYGADGRYVY